MHFIVILLAIVLTACGSGSSGDTSLRQNRESIEPAVTSEPVQPESQSDIPGAVTFSADTSRISIHDNNRVASLTLSTDDYASWINNDDFTNSSKLAPVMASLYTKFNDNFDYIVFVLNEEETPSNFYYSGINVSGVNAITGINKPLRARTPVAYGASIKLKGVLQMTRLRSVKQGPMLHELMHTWGNFVVDTKVPSYGGGTELSNTGHWGASSVGGQLGGFALSTLSTNVDGDATKYQATKGTSTSFGYYANGGNSVPYADLELYLMGLIPAADVGDIEVFKGVSAGSADFSYGKFYATSRETVTIEDIVLEHGARNPSYLTAQTDFKMLVVVVTDTDLTTAEWAAIDGDVDWFTQGASAWSWPKVYNFVQATGERATMEADITNADIR